MEVGTRVSRTTQQLKKPKKATVNEEKNKSKVE
jgi:hypothetical protein